MLAAPNFHAITTETISKNTKMVYTPIITQQWIERLLYTFPGNDFQKKVIPSGSDYILFKARIDTFNLT